MKGRFKAERSAKSDKRLRELDVERMLRDGGGLALLGFEYRLIRSGELARLAFHRDEEGILCVGYAVQRDGEWSVVESEPYTLRALGYYQRRLKRLGERDFPDEDEDDEESDG